MKRKKKVSPVTTTQLLSSEELWTNTTVGGWRWRKRPNWSSSQLQWRVSVWQDGCPDRTHLLNWEEKRGTASTKKDTKTSRTQNCHHNVECRRTWQNILMTQVIPTNFRLVPYSVLTARHRRQSSCHLHFDLVVSKKEKGRKREHESIVHNLRGHNN